MECPDVPSPHFFMWNRCGVADPAGAEPHLPGEGHAACGEGPQGHPRDQHCAHVPGRGGALEVLPPGALHIGGAGCEVVVLRRVHHARSLVRAGHRLCHGVLHLAQLLTCARDLGDAETVGGHRHHLRPRPGLPFLHRARDLPRRHHPHCPQPLRHVWRGAWRSRHAGHYDHGADHRCLWPNLGQRGRHRRDGRFARDCARPHGLPRCRGQHHGGHWQGLRHRLRGAGEPRAVRRLHRARGGEKRGHSEPLGLHWLALWCHDALCLCSLDHEVCGHGGERHAEGVPQPVPENHERRS
mmetsp:Transcript_49960/g.138749  ORF Transcript_49960/g.138749 Transcript_49960/m.138749 type:complete len:297 (+) Transcript_49960:883-1773(+)